MFTSALLLFLRDGDGHRPIFGRDPIFQANPSWKDLIHFHEYFHGESGAGLGARHQIGWTALIANLIQDRVRTTVSNTDGR